MRLRVRAFKTKSGFRYSGGEEKRLDRILTQRDLDAPEVLLHDALQVDQVPRSVPLQHDAVPEMRACRIGQ